LESQIKYYSVDYAVKMLPLTISYCRDLENLYNDYIVLHLLHDKLKDLTTIDNESKNKIKNRKREVFDGMDLLIERVKRWRTELYKLHISMCSVKLGRLNVPIYDDATKSIISLCIHKNSQPNNLEWHLLNDSHEQAHPYWYKYSEYNGLLLPESLG